MASVASLLNDETFSNFPDKFALDAKKSHENCATLLSNLGPLLIHRMDLNKEWMVTPSS